MDLTIYTSNYYVDISGTVHVHPSKAALYSKVTGGQLLKRAYELRNEATNMLPLLLFMKFP